MRLRNVPLGAVVFGLVVALLRFPTEDNKLGRSACSAKKLLYELDLGGSVLLVASISCLFPAMQWGGQRLPWDSPTIIGLFTTFAILLVLFLLLERKMGGHAYVPFRVLKQRSIAFGTIYLFWIAMSNFSVCPHLIASKSAR
jgi:hypothetical protein